MTPDSCLRRRLTRPLDDGVARWLGVIFVMGRLKINRQDAKDAKIIFEYIVQS